MISMYSSHKYSTNNMAWMQLWIRKGKERRGCVPNDMYIHSSLTEHAQKGPTADWLRGIELTDVGNLRKSQSVGNY